MSDYSTIAASATLSAAGGTTSTAAVSTAAATTAASASTTYTNAERIYHQQAASALDNHGVHLAGLVQGTAEALPFADASFDAVGKQITNE